MAFIMNVNIYIVDPPKSNNKFQKVFLWETTAANIKFGSG